MEDKEDEGNGAGTETLAAATTESASAAKEEAAADASS
jgi:hypothetical protein